jgi:hypothetical protein
MGCSCGVFLLDRGCLLNGRHLFGRHWVVVTHRRFLVLRDFTLVWPSAALLAKLIYLSPHGCQLVAKGVETLVLVA